VHTGLGCGINDGEMDSSSSLFFLPSYPETTVAPKEEIDACFICQSPLDRIDAKSTRYSTVHITNHAVNNTATKSKKEEDAVVVTCGDWKWTTDERNRSGWQSDEFGSIIQFRLKGSDTQTISMTYMRSHDIFGNLRVTFRTVTKD